MYLGAEAQHQSLIWIYIHMAFHLEFEFAILPLDGKLDTCESPHVSQRLLWYVCDLLHANMRTHIYTYTYTHTYTHIHTYTHTHIHTYTPTHIHTYTPALHYPTTQFPFFQPQDPTHKPAWFNSCVNMNTQTYIQNAHMYVCVHAYILPIHTYIHTYTHPYIHTYKIIASASRSYTQTCKVQIMQLFIHIHTCMYTYIIIASSSRSYS